MKRIVSILLLCVLMLSLSSVAMPQALVTASDSSAQLSTTDWWPMFHHDPRHTGYSTSTAPNTNNTLWKYFAPRVGIISKSFSGYIGSPVVADGRVYATTPKGGWVYCWNASSGELIWITDYYQGFKSCPAVADGKVYVGVHYGALLGGQILCFHASNGSLAWSSWTSRWVKCSPTVALGRVYHTSDDGKLWCLNASTGANIWDYTIGPAVDASSHFHYYSSPAVAPTTTLPIRYRVYVGSVDGKVYCLDAYSGELVWTYQTGGPVDSSPAVARMIGGGPPPYPYFFYNLLYVGSDDGNVYCLNAAGTKIWGYQTGDDVDSSPAVAYGKVYVENWANLYCLNCTTGSPIWIKENVNRGGGWDAPAVADGKVYVGGGYTGEPAGCIDASTGASIWNYTIPNEDYSSAAVADGKVYVGSGNINKDGILYCFGPTPFDFSVSATPSTRIVVAGSSASYTAKATLVSGSGTVTWSASGLPSGATYTFTPLSGTPTFSSTFKVKTTTTTPPGVYTITITGIGPCIHGSHSTTVTLKVMSFTVSPNPFSPNGDGVKDRTTIKATFWQSLSWSLIIKDSAGREVRTLASGTSLSLTQTWDGKNNAGAYVPDGTYTVVLSGPGFTKTKSVVVDTVKPTVTCSWSPTSFDPHPPASETSTLTYTLSEKCSISIGIYDSVNNLVKTLLATTTKGAGTYNIIWYGRNNAGVKVGPGTYTTKLFVTDMAGNNVSPYPKTCTIQVV